MKMKKLRLLLLDANVVIKLFELDLWDAVVEKCEIILSRTVAENEVQFFYKNGLQEEIDLSSYVNQGVVAIVDVTTSDVIEFRNRFDPTYLDRLDVGETESLVYLLGTEEDYLFSSGDSIVYEVLGRLNRGEQGISLEEILQRIGYGRKLPNEYTYAFRKKWTNMGQQEFITGIGLKKC
ncbi:MAG: hypothetical protein ACMUIS_06640 [bacterium]